MEAGDLQRRFTYHPPTTDEQVAKYANIRAKALEFSVLLNELCPESREKSLAITKLEEVVFWGNASIARVG